MPAPEAAPRSGTIVNFSILPSGPKDIPARTDCGIADPDGCQFLEKIGGILICLLDKRRQVLCGQDEFLDAQEEGR